MCRVRGVCNVVAAAAPNQLPVLPVLPKASLVLPPPPPPPPLPALRLYRGIPLGGVLWICCSSCFLATTAVAGEAVVVGEVVVGEVVVGEVVVGEVVVVGGN